MGPLEFSEVVHSRGWARRRVEVGNDLNVRRCKKHMNVRQVTLM